jgi:ureidoglycolate lyase
MIVVAEPLTQDAYAPFGELIAADRSDVPDRPANQGTARRRDFLVEAKNLRPGASLNVASFRCAPRTGWPMPLALLEKHPESTQMFVPMNARRYLVVVALGGDEPDLRTVRAFLAGPTQGVSYRPGTWHHPMIALDAPIDFACFVWEDGTAADCVVADLAGRGVTIALPT